MIFCFYCLLLLIFIGLIIGFVVVELFGVVFDKKLLREIFVICLNNKYMVLVSIIIFFVVIFLIEFVIEF